jgi:hypothetical protein
MKRPLMLYPLLLLHVFLSIGALYGGGLLLLNPDGSSLGMDPEWLSQLPFKSFLIPGLILFSLFGIGSLFTTVGLILKPMWRWANCLNIYPKMHWAWTYSLFTGIILIIWIVVQQFVIQFFWLQPIMILTGLLIMVIILIPAVIKYFEITVCENTLL